MEGSEKEWKVKGKGKERFLGETAFLKLQMGKRRGGDFYDTVSVFGNRKCMVGNFACGARKLKPNKK